mmetsp:Transcript_24107/g.29202  ORF Transcript_24107/g.29202 Transcript_24107/m.29202 type:complete len:104 (+) Transcript_24107:827-1138(+)
MHDGFGKLVLPLRMYTTGLRTPQPPHHPPPHQQPRQKHTPTPLLMTHPLPPSMICIITAISMGGLDINEKMTPGTMRHLSITISITTLVPMHLSHPPQVHITG